MTRSSPPSSRKVQVCALACWLEVSIRWVLMTALGVPVEPDVNRNFAIVSDVIAANAFSTPGVSGVAAMLRNGIVPVSSTLPLTIAAECIGLIAATAAANGFVAG